jgi:hypothetical protein
MTLRHLVAIPLQGLMRLLRGDRAGLDAIGAGSDAGWIASFLIPAILIAPAYAWMTVRRLADLDAAPDLDMAFPVEAIGYVVGWTAFPVVSHVICERLGKGQSWYGYIAAYNWANVLQIAFYLPAALLGTIEGIPSPILFFVNVAAVAAAIAIHFRVVRVALGLAATQALMLVATDLAVGQLIARLVDRIHGF